MIILSLVCALILSVLASALAKPKEIAKDLDRSKQMMIAAKILSHDGHFLIRDGEGNFVPAEYLKDGVLAPNPQPPYATQAQMLEVYKQRLAPLLVDSSGNLTTFGKAGINADDYLINYRKSGYYLQPYKLVYKILPNPGMEAQMIQGTDPLDAKAIGYVIPVNGFGLWDAIYGYLAIATDGNTVIGITWYDQKETPGLGANIAEAYWQSFLPTKDLPGERRDHRLQERPLGITVVKGKVAEVLGDAPKAKSAVDGMAGATLTGNGVNDAYESVLAAYRPFLLKLRGRTKQQQKP